MGCNDTYATPLDIVWTGGSATAIVHPRTGAIHSSRLHDGRVTLEIRKNTGALDVRAAIEYSNDGLSWDAAVAFGPAYSSANDFVYDTGFTDLTTLGTRKRYARFVLLCKNASGTDIEYACVGLSIDTEGSE